MALDSKVLMPVLQLWEPELQAGKCACCDYSQAEACVPGTPASGKPGGVRTAESLETARLASGKWERWG